MRIHILGAGAGGGFPQWNCNCRNCDGLRKGTIRASARTQSSIVATGDDENWVLFNASPDVLQQLQQFPALQPARALRDTAIRAIVLIDAQIDHTTGLYMLRDPRQPHALWCTSLVREDLTAGNPVLNVLGHYCGLNWHDVPLAERFTMNGVPGLTFEALPLTSNAPPYSPHRDRPQPGDNIGVTLVDAESGKRLFYAPGLGRTENHVWAAMQAADCVLVDGTLWTDDEMITRGLGSKTGGDMGHLPQTGAPGRPGMIQALDQLGERRKILIHINNTNPILDEDSPQRAELARHGIEVSYDGMEIIL